MSVLCASSNCSAHPSAHPSADAADTPVSARRTPTATAIARCPFRCSMSLSLFLFISVSLFMFFSLIVNACSAGQTCGASEDETRPTSRVSQSPLSAPPARSKDHQTARLCPRESTSRSRELGAMYGAVGVVLISKLGTEQVLFCTDA